MFEDERVSCSVFCFLREMFLDNSSVCMIVDIYIHMSVCKCLSVRLSTQLTSITAHQKGNHKTLLQVKLLLHRTKERVSERAKEQTLDAFKEIQQNKKLRRWEIVFMNIAPTKCYAHTHEAT